MSPRVKPSTLLRYEWMNPRVNEAFGMQHQAEACLHGISRATYDEFPIIKRCVAGSRISALFTLMLQGW